MLGIKLFGSFSILLIFFSIFKNWWIIGLELLLGLLFRLLVIKCLMFLEVILYFFVWIKVLVI